jgi:hypothetical protein
MTLDEVAVYALKELKGEFLTKFFVSNFVTNFFFDL